MYFWCVTQIFLLILKVLFKWTFCGLSLTYNYKFKVYSVFLWYIFILQYDCHFCNIITLHNYNTMFLSVLILLTTFLYAFICQWTFCLICWLLWVMLQWTRECSSLSEILILVLLDKYPEVGLRNHIFQWIYLMSGVLTQYITTHSLLAFYVPGVLGLCILPHSWWWFLFASAYFYATVLHIGNILRSYTTLGKSASVLHSRPWALLSHHHRMAQGMLWTCHKPSEWTKNGDSSLVSLPPTLT